MNMAEHYPLPPKDRLEVVTSSQADELLRRFGLEIVQADALALGALAEVLKAPLPQKPRVLLLQGNEEPHYKDETVQFYLDSAQVPALGRAEAPTYDPATDIIARIYRGIPPSTEQITSAVALSLLRDKRAADNHRLYRIGVGTVATGVACVAAEGLQLPYSGMAGEIGAGIFAVGLGVVVYSQNRSGPEQPDLAYAATLPQPIITAPIAS